MGRAKKIVVERMEWDGLAEEVCDHGICGLIVRYESTRMPDEKASELFQDVVEAFEKFNRYLNDNPEFVEACDNY